MPATQPSPLERELELFQRSKEELLKHHEGSFVLIKDDALIGAFTTEAEAYQAGIERFGNVPFLIKLATREEEVASLPALVLGLLDANP
ncbi:MAG: hypothetical protein HY721_10910 [Planctomycetes bacterium]|nr:hypothetical protein [Planctomycetota bacterium]